MWPGIHTFCISLLVMIFFYVSWSGCVCSISLHLVVQSMTIKLFGLRFYMQFFKTECNFLKVEPHLNLFEFILLCMPPPPRLFLSLSVSLPLSVSRRPSWENQCKASWQRRWSQMTAVRRRREEVFTWKEERALKGSIVLFAVIQSSLQPAHNSVALNRASFSHSNIQAPVLQCSSLIGASFFFLAQEKTN